MYALASKTLKLPVMSLQTGEPIALLGGAIINPASLEVIGYHCEVNPTEGGDPILLLRDIRQFALDCVVVDNEEELVEATDIVRLQDLLRTRFQLIGRPVVTDLGRHLGSVEDYTVNLQTHLVQKLYVKRPMWQFWLGDSLIIDRVQIIDVSPRRIVVRDALVKSPSLSTKPVPETRS